MTCSPDFFPLIEDHSGTRFEALVVADDDEGSRHGGMRECVRSRQVYPNQGGEKPSGALSFEFRSFSASIKR